MTKFNRPGMLDLRGKWWCNCKPSKCIVAWDCCVVVRRFIWGDGGVYWSCRWSCMILFPKSTLLVTLVLLLGSCGSWTRRLMLASNWSSVLKLECDFKSWVEEGRWTIAWIGLCHQKSENSVHLQHMPCSRPVRNWPNLEQVSCSWLNLFP